MRQSRDSPSASPWWQNVRPGWVLVATFLLFGVVGATFLVRTGPAEGDDGFGGTTIIILSLLVAAALVVVALVGLMLAGVDGSADPLARRLSSDEEERRLLARWLTRARWARNVGGAAGIVAWIAGGGSGDLLLLGVGGIAIGSMLAELHRAAPQSRLRTASLESRSLRDFLERRDLLWMGAASIGVVVIAAGDLIVGADRMVAPWALTALLVLALALAVQHRVATRPRPAVSQGLRAADDLARRLAIGPGLAQPATYFALALVAHPLLSSPLGVVIWLIALGLWWSNRRLGIERLIDRGRIPLAQEPAAA